MSVFFIMENTLLNVKIGVCIIIISQMLVDLFQF